MYQSNLNMLNQRKNYRANPLMGVLTLVISIVIIYFLVKGLFYLASWAMPILAIATLIINHNVYLDFGKFISNIFKENWVLGIGAVLLTLALLPFVVFYLFGKAMMLRKIDNSKAESIWNKKEEKDDEYLEFEEIVDEEPTIIELPDVGEVKNKKRDDNSYDEFFK